MRHLRFFLRFFLLFCAVVAGTLLALALTVWLHFDGTYTGLAPYPGSASGSGQALLRQGYGGQGRGVVCGLVFGAAVHGNSQPGPGIARRVETAARLYREGILQQIIMTGGKGRDGVESEAAVMRDFGIAEGIDPDVIVVEDQARSTWENLVYSRPLTASCSTIIGISDRYHLARIEYLAHLQGLQGLQTLPSDISATTAFEIKSLGREVAALLYYISLSPFL
ncbi:MAG: YdcF family protein [Candidatus Peribacteraceae bacterium]|nr:YdcF family protein [Candidatus Peribacteraceae bacterium]